MNAARRSHAPMFPLLCAFAGGVLLGWWIGPPVWETAICLVICYIMAFRLRKGRGADIYLLCAMALCGMAATGGNEQTPPVGKRLLLNISIDDNPVDRGAYKSFSATVNDYRLAEDSLWHNASWRVMATADSSRQFSLGDRLCVETVLRPIADSASSYSALMEARGYGGRIAIYPGTRTMYLGSNNRSLRHAALSLQKAGEQKLDSYGIQGQGFAICKAMLIGRRGTLEPALRDAYADGGAAHLLAVSGLHVGIIFALANILLRWLTLFRRGNLMLNIAVIIVVWIYTAATGMAVSAIRAAIMFTALQAAIASGAIYRSANILSATALIIIAVNPDLLRDVSFQLSFAAVAAIIYWGVPLCRAVRSRWPVMNFFTATVAIGLTASAATIPLTAYWFDRISLIGVFLNPVVITLAYAIVCLTLVALLLPAPWAAHAAAWIAGAQNRFVATAAGFEWAAVDFSLPGWGVVAIYAAAIAATELCKYFRQKKSVSLPAS